MVPRRAFIGAPHPLHFVILPLPRCLLINPTYSIWMNFELNLMHKNKKEKSFPAPDIMGDMGPGPSFNLKVWISTYYMNLRPPRMIFVVDKSGVYRREMTLDRFLFPICDYPPSSGLSGRVLDLAGNRHLAPVRPSVEPGPDGLLDTRGRGP